MLYIIFNFCIFWIIQACYYLVKIHECPIIRVFRSQQWYAICITCFTVTGYLKYPRLHRVRFAGIKRVCPLLLFLTPLLQAFGRRLDPFKFTTHSPKNDFIMTNLSDAGWYYEWYILLGNRASLSDNTKNLVPLGHHTFVCFLHLVTMADSEAHWQLNLNPLHWALQPAFYKQVIECTDWLTPIGLPSSKIDSLRMMQAIAEVSFQHL